MSKSVRYLIILILALLIPLGFFATEFMSVSSFGYTESVSVAEMMEEASDVLASSYLSDVESLGIVILIGSIGLVVIVAVLNIIFAIAHSKYGVFVSSIIGICLTAFLLFVFYIAALEMGSDAVLEVGTSPWFTALGFVATLVLSATERKAPATVSGYDVPQQVVTPIRIVTPQQVYSPQQTAPANGWFCTNCGKKNDETARFCGFCGTANKFPAENVNQNYTATTVKPQPQMQTPINEEPTPSVPLDEDAPTVIVAKKPMENTATTPVEPTVAEPNPESAEDSASE